MAHVGQVHPDQVVVLHRGRQPHREVVEGNHLELVDHQNHFDVEGSGTLSDAHRRPAPLGVLVVVDAFGKEGVGLNADKHVDGVVNLEGLGVHLGEAFLAKLTELALDAVEAVTNKVLVQIAGHSLRLQLSDLRGNVVVLVDVGAEGLFMLGRQRLEVGFVLEVLDYGLLDVCVGEEFFYAHVLAAN